jgi:hypothetical protein
MKNKSIVGLAVIIITVLVPLINVQAVTDTLYYIEDNGADNGALALDPNKDQLWWSPKTNRWWFFGQWNNSMWAWSSVDGITWIQTFMFSRGAFESRDCAWWVQEEITETQPKLHVAMADYLVNDFNLNYSMWWLQDDGSIILDNDGFQLVYNPAPTDRWTNQVQIVCNTDGYPYIFAYNDEQHPAIGFMVIAKNSVKDGRWIMEVGYPNITFTLNEMRRIEVKPLSNNNLVVVSMNPTNLFIHYGANDTWVQEAGNYPTGAMDVGVFPNDDVVISHSLDAGNDYDIYVTVRYWNNGSQVQYKVWENPAPIGDYVITEITVIQNSPSRQGWIYIMWACVTGNNCPLGDYTHYVYSQDRGKTWSAVQNWIDSTGEPISELYPCAVWTDIGNSVAMSWMGDADTALMFAYMNEPVRSPKPDLKNYTFNGMEDDLYLYMGEIYELEAWVNNTNYLYFEMNDTRHIWRYTYRNDTGQMWLNVTDYEGLKENEAVIGLISQNETQRGTLRKLQWRFVLDKQVLDVYNTTISWYGLNFAGNLSSGGDIGGVSIYNLGGYVDYTFVGDGQRISGGDNFELEVRNATQNSSAYAEEVYRKLQWVHLKTELYHNMSWDGLLLKYKVWDTVGTGNLEMGMQFRYNGVWHDGWYCDIYLNGGNIGYMAGWGQDRAFLKYRVRWWNGQVLQHTDTIYAYNDAYYPAGSNGSTRHSTPFFIDLWFNRMNSSTTIGGRVTPVYYGVEERGWWGMGDFRPVIDDEAYSDFFDDLILDNGTIISSQYIEEVRFWVKISKIADDNVVWRVHSYASKNFQKAIDRMDGIDTPDPNDIEMPAITTTNFLTPLYKALQNIGNTIWNAGLQFIKVLWAFMDNLLVSIGLPTGTWSRIIAFFMAIPRMLVALLMQINIMIDTIIALVGSIFPFLLITIPRFLWTLGTLATSFTSWWREIINLFTGTYSQIGNWWALLAVEQWILLGLMVILPINEFDIIFSDRDPMKKAVERLKIYSSFFTGLFDFFKGVAEFIILIAGFIRRLLPF